MTDEKLLPCPFCGEDGAKTIKEDKFFISVCAWCGAQTSPCKDMQEAADAWNTRAPQSHDEVREAVDKAVWLLEHALGSPLQSPPTEKQTYHVSELSEEDFNAIMEAEVPAEFDPEKPQIVVTVTKAKRPVITPKTCCHVIQSVDGVEDPICIKCGTDTAQDKGLEALLAEVPTKYSAEFYHFDCSYSGKHIWACSIGERHALRHLSAEGTGPTPTAAISAALDKIREGK